MLTGLPAEVRPDTASLRCVVCGAAPMPAAAIHEFEDRYGVPILEGYGQSEGTVVTTANPLTGVRKPGTVCLPSPGQEVRVVGEDGPRTVTSPTCREGNGLSIEEALCAHLPVLEAAVVGRPDPLFGEEPVAFVVLRPGLAAEPDELIEHCKQVLAKFKVRRAVFIEADLPRTPIGKIAKPELRERISSPTARGA